MGAITPLGLDVESSWEALLAGRSGITFDKNHEAAGLTCQIWGQIYDFEPQEWISAREARRMPRFAQLAVAAAIQAVHDSKLDLSSVSNERVGVVIGTAFGGTLIETQEATRVMIEKDAMRVSPFYLLRMLPNVGTYHICHHFDIVGYSNTIVTACASGTQAIGEAAEVIRRGQADVVIVGGTDCSVCELGVASMCVMHGLSTRNHEPERASRPFERSRDGFVPGEGCAMLVLESLQHAQRRGAKLYAEIVGYAASVETHHIIQPDLEGRAAARTMCWALEDAGIQPSEIDYISAHAAGTPLGDKAETNGIKHAFGDLAYQIPISSTKSMTGHMSGGSGAFEVIACIQSIQTGMIHPTINYEEPDPDCDLDYVPNVPRQADVKYALSNSFGIGGQNACLVLSAVN